MPRKPMFQINIKLFFPYVLVSFFSLSLIRTVFDLKEVCSSKQVLSSFLSQIEEKNKRVAKLDDKKSTKKCNQTRYLSCQLNILICNVVGPKKYFLIFTKFPFSNMYKRHKTYPNPCHLHGLLLHRS